jgi:hypothetical protein
MSFAAAAAAAAGHGSRMECQPGSDTLKLHGDLQKQEAVSNSTHPGICLHLLSGAAAGSMTPATAAQVQQTVMSGAYGCVDIAAAAAAAAEITVFQLQLQQSSGNDVFQQQQCTRCATHFVQPACTQSREAVHSAGNCWSCGAPRDLPLTLKRAKKLYNTDGTCRTASPTSKSVTAAAAALLATVCCSASYLMRVYTHENGKSAMQQAPKAACCLLHLHTAVPRSRSSASARDQREIVVQSI